MERFAVLVFSYGIILSLCFVPSTNDQPDIVKRMETCQEVSETVSEQPSSNTAMGFFFAQSSIKVGLSLRKIASDLCAFQIQFLALCLGETQH